jgi:hypothetical protein
MTNVNTDDRAYNKTWWLLDFEVRQQGAIGEFTWVTREVRADTQEIAVKWALDDIHMDGLESRGVRNIRQGRL